MKVSANKCSKLSKKSQESTQVESIEGPVTNDNIAFGVNGEGNGEGNKNK